MKKYTQAEFDALPVIDGRKQCPTGDYSDIRSFGEWCSFGERCSFGFAPHCMAPMTDEAVQMVMERLEALRGETETD